MFIACRKNFTESTTNTFSQSEAKEWYYGTFKKSPEWQQSNEKGKKLPDWKNGTYRRVGNMEIVEFPLMKERKSYAIPSAGNLSSSEIRKITDGSLSRIAFIRASNNEIVVRELDYIPDINFLELKGYDISDIKVGNKENNFSGRIITKKWNGTILSTRKSENGKITKTGKRINNANLKSNSLSSTTTNNSSGCEMIEICEYERFCEEVHVGDVWVPNGICTPWEPTGNCWVEEYCGPGECDYGSANHANVNFMEWVVKVVVVAAKTLRQTLVLMHSQQQMRLQLYHKTVTIQLLKVIFKVQTQMQSIRLHLVLMQMELMLRR